MQIDYSVFLDKVHGCWYGKCLGGAAGAPLEGIKGRLLHLLTWLMHGWKDVITQCQNMDILQKIICVA